jgi:hypothetical protein
VTTPPSELSNVSPAAGIAAVSLKMTTVFPVGIPLVTLMVDWGVDGIAVDRETAVGASEQAAMMTAAGTTSTDHRARLARIDIVFSVLLLRPDLFPARLRANCRADGPAEESGDIPIFRCRPSHAARAGISTLP